MKKIAIQGIAGSFHHLAAQKFFGDDIQLCPCNYFDEIPGQVLGGNAFAGILAIENTLAGSILPNYMLIDEHDLQITGEIYIPVQHALLGLPGTALQDIKEVYSHPMALLQCKGFFGRNPGLKRIEFDDTALAAKMIGENKLVSAAAIAPEMAAGLYGLEILASSIQDHHTNTTRFVVVQKMKNNINLPPGERLKISFKSILKHQSGSLVEFLEILKSRKMNMTKIQSVPLFGQPWFYAFFIDALFDRGDDIFYTLNLLKESSEQFKILGIYPEGNKEEI